MKNKIFKKIVIVNNFFIVNFNKINELIKVTNNKFKKISSFNKSLIFIIITLFLYLFFLSIPSLYNKDTLQTKLNNMINKEYNINISLSSDLSYKILPKPHIEVKNAKIYTNELKSPKEFGQIKELKIFIEQKNFFNQEKIQVKKIILNEANFSIYLEDLKYLQQFMEKKFSKKKIEINNSKIFYKDNKENVISMFPILKSNFFYDEKKFSNTVILKGDLYTIPYSFIWNKYFNNNLNESFLKLKKLNMKMQNFTKKENLDLLIKNYIFFRSFEMATDVLVKKDSIEIKSSEGENVKNQELKYNGKINLKPFSLFMDIELDELDFKKNIFNNNLVRSLFELRSLYSKNLNSQILLKIDNLKKNKLFNFSEIFIQINNGEINFNKTIFIGELGSLNLVNSNIENFKDDLIFNGNFKFAITSEDEFFRLFQITKKNRKKIDFVYFDIVYNLTKNNFEIKNIIFEPGNIVNENDLIDFLNNNKYDYKINNWIDFRNLVNKVFIDYYEG